MGSNPYDAYKDTQIKTASREQILLMLYEGAIKYMKQGQEAMNDEEHQRAHNKLLQAQDIVTELMASLDMDIAGDVGEDLYALYDYVLHNLVQANVEQNPHKIGTAIDIMTDLNDAWDTVINEQGMTYEKAKKQYDEQEKDGVQQEASPPPALKDKESEDDERKEKNTSSGQTNKSGQSSQSGGSQQSSDDLTYGDLSIQG